MGILIYKSITMLLNLINFLVLVRIIFSWIPMDNALVRIVYNLTEPLLYPIRKLLKKSPLGDGMMLDFSPIILVLLLGLIQRLAFSILF